MAGMVMKLTRREIMKVVLDAYKKKCKAELTDLREKASTLYSQVNSIQNGILKEKQDLTVETHKARIDELRDTIRKSGFGLNVVVEAECLSSDGTMKLRVEGASRLLPDHNKQVDTAERSAKMIALTNERQKLIQKADRLETVVRQLTNGDDFVMEVMQNMPAEAIPHFDAIVEVFGNLVEHAKPRQD